MSIRNKGCSSKTVEPDIQWSSGHLAFLGTKSVVVCKFQKSHMEDELKEIIEVQFVDENFEKFPTIC